MKQGSSPLINRSRLSKETRPPQYGETVISQMAKLKLVFDPNMILNIGNIFEEKYLRG